MFNNLDILNFFSSPTKPNVNSPDFLNISLQNDLLSLMTPQALELQAQALRREIVQLIQIKNTLLKEISPKPLQKDLKPIEKISSQQNPENISSTSSPTESGVPKLQKSNRVQIREMVEFLLVNVGHLKESELEKEKLKYFHNDILCELFDNLVSKYASSVKTKEEIIKLVLRKALKSMKNSYKKQFKMNSKTAFRSMISKYFPNSNALIVEKVEGLDNDDEEEVLNSVLPFR